MKKCKHTEIYYYPAVNEDGWKCASCGKEFGHRPDYDKKRIYDKVHGLLNDINMAKLIHVSNGTEGDIITMNVVRECQKLKLYDQYTIIEQILQDPNLHGHAKYWAEQAKKWKGPKRGRPKQAITKKMIKQLEAKQK